MIYPLISSAQAQPLIGQLPIGVPIGLDTPNADPRAVDVNIDWSLYPKNNRNAAAVFISLSGLQPANRLDQIRAIRIENKNSNQIIWVLFGSTGQIVECPPGTTMEPVIAARDNLDVTVYAEGFVSGQFPQTNIQFLNVNRAGYFIPEDGNVGPTLQYLGNQRQIIGATPSCPFAPTFQIPGPISANSLLVMGVIVSSNVQISAAALAPPVAFCNFINGVWAGFKQKSFVYSPALILDNLIVPGALAGTITFTGNVNAAVNIVFYMLRGVRSMLPVGVSDAFAGQKANLYVPGNSAAIVLGQNISGPFNNDYNANTEMAVSATPPNEGSIALTDTLSNLLGLVWR